MKKDVEAPPEVAIAQWIHLNLPSGFESQAQQDYL